MIRRMSPPRRESLAKIGAAGLCVHVAILANWRNTWRLQGEVLPESEKEPEAWNAVNKFTMVIKSAVLNASELTAYCRERF